MRQFRQPTFRVFLILSTLGLGACTDDAMVVDDDGDFADDPAGDDEPGDPQTSELRWVPARGISILEIEANQGTRVALTGDKGDWVGPDQRNMKLVSNRDTLLRVHWKVAEGWEPHEVKARMVLDTGDGRPIVREQTRMVSGDSTRTSLDRTFYFGLVADDGETVPGAKVSVELYEADVEQNSKLPMEVQTAPADGSELIGFESDPLQMKLVLVPIHYTGAGNDRRPDLGDKNVKTLIDSLYEENPVQEIKYQVRGEIGYDEPMVNLGALLPLMSAVKSKDGADPNIYYHAFIDVGCPVVGCGNYGVAGIAQMSGSGQNASLTRVAASVYWEDKSGNIARTADTFVHELGHNQGLAHVACPGVNAAGPDPNYPYANGKIGEWGFGIRSYTLHNPTASHDYMTYCGNSWGSDWTFLKTYERIRTLTSWDMGAAADMGEAPGDDEWVMGEQLVIGALYPDGTEQWFTLPGGIDVEEIVPDETLAFGIGGQEIEQPTVIQTLSDGETQWVVAPLPEGTDLTAVDQVTHLRRGEVRRVVPGAEIVKDLVGGTDITF
ncbi:MAG TPA: zinc-dependent metalloprotease family protein [Enhygromyxa sp.]|nr:zinc-dependent metalloprotease family protein [Enhygromyxa sp.]